MKRFLVRFTIMITPFILLVGGVNYSIDVANLFSSGLEEKIATLLLQSNLVTNVGNFDERLLQQNYIEKSQACPELIVLGSSRTMLIHKDYFPNQSFHNHSLSAASLGDLLAIYQLYEAKKCYPKHIILGLDPWLLNDNNDKDGWITLEEPYNIMLEKLGIPPKNAGWSKYKKYTQLLSPSYFQSCYKQLAHKSKSNIEIATTKENVDMTRVPDGSICYGTDMRDADMEMVKQRAILATQGNIYGLENFLALSPEIKDTFELFLNRLKKNGTQIKFVLTPYHPFVYDFLSKNEKYKQLENAERYYQKLGEDLDIPVVGSFSPYALKFDESYFYDGGHSKEKGIDILMTW